MVKKTSNQEATAAVIVDENELSGGSEETQSFSDLSDKLAEIRKDKNVIGYIIKNDTSATIDLKEPEKIVDYALFSSHVIESSRDISDAFEIGNVESILVEGKENNALCIIIDGNMISIFMNKTADHSDILKRVSP